MKIISKSFIITVVIILITAIITTTIFICIKNVNEKSVQEENDAVISTAIRALSDSNYRDIELANMIYTVGLSKSSFIKENFAQTAKETLNSIIGGTTYESLLKMIPESLYGGKNVSAAISGIKGEPSLKIESNDLVVGDLLFIANGDTAKNYIYDKDGLVDLSAPSEKIDTQAVLNRLSNSDIYAVFRPSLVIDNYDYITEKSPKLDLTLEQEAVIETAKAYLLRGENLQYADTRLGTDANSEFRWKAGFYSPEYYSKDNWGYTNCAAFTYDVYFSALDFNLQNENINLYTTNNLMHHTDDIGIRKYHMVCNTSDTYTEEDKQRIKNEIYDILQPADILVVRRNGNGHAMLYVGNGNIIHSSGSVYNYNESSERYEASIRQMRFDDYFFTEGAGGYIFGSDIGKNISSFAIIRPLDIFDGEIPEITKNRLKNMRGIKAQKLSSHNSSKTVNLGEEITFTFEVYNTNNYEVTLDICDTVPSHTAYISGADRVEGDSLYWTVEVPANTRKSVSYKVKVKENAVIDGVIKSKNSTVGGVPVESPSITIKRTLNSEEQQKIANAILNYKNDEKLTGFELVNEIYKNAIGIDKIFDKTEFDSIVCNQEEGILFGFGSVLESGLSSYKFNEQSKYLDLIVPTMYGGRHFVRTSWGDRTRLARELNLVIGDILVRKTLQQNQVFIYSGDGKFYNLTDGINVDTLDAKRRLETTLGTGHIYVILRPSFSLK